MDLPWKAGRDHPSPHELRASDADRENVVRLLRDAHGDGRITLVEHGERVEQAYAARTLGELAGLTGDLLPADEQPIRLDPGPLHALFGTVRRDGRWVVPARFPVAAVFGTLEIDLREALLQRRHVVVNASVLGGRLRLVVPEGVRVEFTGRSMAGAQALRLRQAAGADGPLIEVRGTVVLGSVSARSPKRPRRPRLRRGRAG
ncbi:DUF1707 domain-containing protein [Actinomadura sp. DC4]|uniref:DUF1707 SHOCT-like domain-containing protein n=1 Tax=Actinomadura sp. DC4 TaxID=3055069 RepID=UPI0025AFA5E5|nr:DUF1707 domain-containing protein [Actinomadura sp. DC4]MDN3352602.1 DUF1707 domain-containing protein [Actinomadura sp. DC4]